jgi:hypothetical protein
MERNWLIRTTQNQILGPVAKSKVLEFLEKGALGKDDEVTSGNGYWFSLKEKDLVDKYLYGDIPQGYNPISESKSVLSKRENPEKTTSINTAPANSAQDKNKAHHPSGVSPKDEDLEYPDTGSDITLVGVSLSKLPLKPNLASGKLPDASDLEFPDMTDMVKNVSSASSEHKTSVISANTNSSSTKAVQHKAEPKVDLEFSAAAENFKYPEESNLDYPDLTAVTKNKTQTQIQVTTEPKTTSMSQSNHTQTMTVAMAKSHSPDPVQEEEEDRDFTVVLNAPSISEKPKTEEIIQKPVAEKQQIESLIGPIIKEKKSVKPAPTPKPVEERKLLHDRKKQTQSDHAEENTPQARRPVVSEELKSRNDNYLLYLIILLVIIIIVLFVYYYKTILNKPLPV